MAKSQFYSVVVPIVGTLNDVVAATPVIYRNDGIERIVLEETPGILMRKERMGHHLRCLPCRFLKGERLMLTAFLLTQDNRNIDATNVLDLIQNAGNKVIWCDDSQFISVRCDRFVWPHLKKKVSERTVVYISEVGEKLLSKPTYRASRYSLIIKDFEEHHDDIQLVRQVFGLGDCGRYYREGFWKDDRFLDVPCLTANYQKWLLQHLEQVPASR